MLSIETQAVRGSSNAFNWNGFQNPFARVTTLAGTLAVIVALSGSAPADQILGFRADDPNITESGGFVTIWPDQALANGAQNAVSGLVKDAEGFTGPTRTTVDVNAISRNRAAIHFDGASQILQSTQTVPIAEGSFFAVLNNEFPSGPGTGNHRVIGWENSLTGEGGGVALIDDFGNGPYAVVSPGPDINNAAAPAISSTFETISITWGLAGRTLHRNNGDQTSILVGSNVSIEAVGPGTPHLNIGGAGDADVEPNNEAGNPDGELWKGNVLELRAYDEQLTEVQREAVEAELYNTWYLAPGPPPRTFTWNVAGPGDWNSLSNWSPNGGPPNGNHDAIFGNKITANRTVFTDTAVTVRRIEFDNQDNSYFIAGAGNVNLVTGTDSMGDVAPTIDVRQGTHEFQVRVALHNDTTVNVATDSTLIFNNAVDLMGKALTKTGAGEMAIRNDFVTGGGTVNCLQGTCSGSGTISGDLNNDGATISPGNSLESISVVPEPSTAMLVTMHIVALVGYGWRPRKR